MSLLPLNKTANWSLNNKSGEPVVKFTSFLSMDLRDNYQVVEGPVEEGGFASYNKVASPLEIDVSLGIEGDDATLDEALEALNQLAASTEILSVVTPESEYQNMNLESVSYRRRREDGLGVLWLDLKLIEVRQVKAQYTSVKVAEQKKSGKVQAKSPGNQKTEQKNKSFIKGAGDMLRGK